MSEYVGIEKNRLPKHRIAAILIFLYTLPNVVTIYHWLVTDSPMIQDMGINFALSGLVIMLIGFMTAFGIWQDQKVYKIIAMIIFGINAIGALPGILFAPDRFWSNSAFVGVVFCFIIFILLIRRT